MGVFRFRDSRKSDGVGVFEMWEVDIDYILELSRPGKKSLTCRYKSKDYIHKLVMDN